MTVTSAPVVPAERLASVETMLAERLAALPAPISAPCCRIATAPAKRLRPTLVLAAAACAGPGELPPGVIGSAVAVELLHCASLVHDDLIDGASSRRGVPTVNAAEGPAMAIVAGDALIALAGETAAAVDSRTGSAIAAALQELCRGEAREIAGRYRASLTLEEVLETAEAKTASLMGTACRLGAEAAGARPALVAALELFGLAFGTCLQLIDDVLDAVSTDDLLGKPAGNDFASGIVTVPAISALAVSGELRALLRPGLDDLERLRALSLVRKLGGVPDAVELARRSALGAERTLTRAASDGDSQAILALAALPRQYVRRQLATCVPAASGHLLGPRVAAGY